MKPVLSCAFVALVAVVTVGVGEKGAHALISDTPLVVPPDGWQNVCVAHSVELTPTPVSRKYSGSGTCWVNTAQDKTDGNKQNWVRVPVTLAGVWGLQSKSFAEDLSFTMSTGIVPVRTNGSCADDPWATTSQCGATPANVDLSRSFGWPKPTNTGPLSRNVFGTGLISALLSKQLSSPPLAPVDIDPVRWPEPDGTVGRVFWRTPDVSGNRWILAYDIEYASSPDSAFIRVGRVMGPGATMNLSPKDVSRYFYTSLKLNQGAYYFHVCSINDAGRQCSAPKLARQPTLAEQATINRARSSVTMAVAGGSGPTPPTAPATRVAAPPAVRPPVGPVPR